MIEKDFENINEDDLMSLIETELLEGKTLDYKEKFSGNTDADKKEFLADISSFTNSSGGDIIYGIKEEKGIPVDLVGLEINKEGLDSKFLWIDDLIRQGIKPRISGIKSRAIELKNGKYALVIRIPKSWRSPHCVTIKDSFEFYARSSNGKYQLDVDELRSAFNFSDTIELKIKEFREERIAKIIADEGQLKQGNSAKIVVHIIPINSFNIGTKYDVKKMHGKIGQKALYPIYSYGCGYRINFDGINAFDSINQEGISTSYVQMYSNGIIEAVNASIIGVFRDEKIIPSVAYELEIIKSIKMYLEYMKEMNIEPPFVISVALINVKEFTMKSDIIWSPYSNKIDRDLLLPGDIMIEDFNINVEKELKTIFDSIWNACGYQESLNYNKQGEFIRN